MEPFVERIRGDEEPQLTDEFAVQPQLHVGLDAQFQRADALLLEVDDVGLQCPAQRHVRQRRPAPQGQGPAQRLGSELRPARGHVPAPLADERLEHLGVELPLFHAQHVSTGPADQDFAARRLQVLLRENFTKMVDVRLYCRNRTLEGFVAPQFLDNRFDQDVAVRTQQ